ncbi:MAG TPA: hypothetical protein VJN90_07820 [Candidatus Acidoferrales bacterium]|nr:hypothetical protein [Candidatus Acidoferrales bacterium]
MDYAAIGCAIVGLILGLLAARYWFRSSKVAAEPAWAEPTAEPVDLEDKNSDWIAAILDASKKSAAFNQRAAVLTGYAVVLSAFAGVLGSLAGYFR